MSESPTPSLLLRRLHDGDSSALDALLADHLPWIQRRVRQRLGPALRDRLETADLVQEALVDFFTAGPRLEIEDDQALRALLAQVIENNIRDADKFHRRARRDMGRVESFSPDTVLVLHSSGTPSKLVDRDERRAWIRLALEFLGDEDRRVLRLREWEQWTFAAIGEALGIGENGARMRYQRALPKLAKCVGDLRRDGIPSSGP